MDKQVQTKGRVKYIEPTNWTWNGEDVVYNSSTTAMNNPLEDLCIAIDLTVEVPDRKACGLVDSNGQKVTLNYSSTKGTLSFLGGTSGVLTTNYTDISMTDVEKNTMECLGIESIDIVYSSWLYPEVTIKFVDVRGATVMGPQEKSMYDNASPGSFYKALFSFPYPLFTLKVKGFYGKGVTYHLSVANTKMSLNESTGNFDITVSFIGSMYRIYTDMPMTYLAAAPYMEHGAEYWDKMIQEKKFMFVNRDDSTTEMLKFPEFRRRLTMLAENTDIKSAAQEGTTVSSNLEAQKTEAQALIDTFPFVKKEGWTSNRDTQKLYKIVNTEDKGIAEQITEYVSKIIEYDTSYNTTTPNKFLSVFANLAKFGKKKSVKGKNEYKALKGEDVPYVMYTRTIDKKSNKQTDFTVDSNKKIQATYEKYIKKDSDLTNIVETYKTDNLNKAVSCFYVYILPESSGVFDTDTDEERKEKKIETSTLVETYSDFFNDTLKKEVERISEEIDTKKKEYKELGDQMAEKVLGFTPSVMNMYNLIFAHMSTFIECVNDKLRTINSEIQPPVATRKMSYFGNVLSDLVDDGPNDMVPPFPTFYKKETRNGTTRTVEMWPGEILGVEGAKTDTEKKMAEVDLVLDILRAAKLYSEEDEKAAASGADYTNITTSPEDRNERPSTDTTDFIPLTTYDFTNKDKDGNPYNHVKELITTSNESMAGNILLTFALRAYYYCITNGSSKKEMAAFGKIEAANFKRAMNVDANQQFVNFIQKYADGDDKSDDSSEFIDLICGKKPDDAAAKAWSGVGKNSAIFTESNKKLSYDWNTYMPVGTTKINDIKNAFTAGEEKLKENTRFIKIKSLPSASETNKTFYIFNGGSYMKNLIADIKTKGGDGSNDIVNENRSLKKYADLNSETAPNPFNRADQYRLYSLNEKGNISSISGKEAYKTAIAESENSIYVAYPTSWAVSWMPIHIGEVEVSGPKITLFDTPLFKAQVSDNKESDAENRKAMEAKAYLFITAVGNYGTNGGIMPSGENGVAFKAQLLREGAYYWYQNNSLKQSSEKEKMPSKNQCFLSKGWEDGDYTYLVKTEANDKGTYATWVTPQYASPSRKKILKDFFTNWANGEFAKVLPYLTNDKLYTISNGALGMGGMGKYLDPQYITNTKSAENLVIGAKNVQKFLKDIYLGIYTVFDTAAIKDEDKTVEASKLTNAFKGFMKGLRSSYGDYVGTKGVDRLYDQVTKELSTDPFVNKDLRVATYITLKNLYNKWLCAPYKGQNTWVYGEPESDFSSFKYLDVYYHDISKEILANPTKISEWLSSYVPSSNMQTTEGGVSDGTSVYSMLAQIAQDAGGMLMALPISIGNQDRTSEEDMVNMFRAMPYSSSWETDSSSFIFMYTYKPSEHLGTDQYEDDSLDFSADEVDACVSDSGYTIPAFGVTYARQNQSYFSNISLNTDNAGTTEASLAATFSIASKSTTTPRETVLYGQDIYKVLMAYSYQCEFDMLGCAQVAPLMYFQLNNVPLWKGAYVIYKVTHQISAGKMKTHVIGVRVNKNALPLAEGLVVSSKDPGDNGGGRPSSRIGVGGGHASDGMQTYTPGLNITDAIDFKESNITKQKPIIALTPAHGPNTPKSTEWAWSSKLIDNYIIPKLKKLKFKDGTSYADNIQRCNKNGNHTGRGYSTVESKNLVRKYGVDKVVAVVPHWNGAAGQRMDIYCGGYNGNNICGKTQLAENFAKIMLAEANIAKQNAETKYPSLPVKGAGNNMMSGKNGILVLPAADDGSIRDGAATYECAGVLAECWFADYPQTDSDKWPDYNAKVDGRYKTGRGWLESDEGYNAVSDVIVNSIKKYIDTLSGDVKKETPPKKPMVEVDEKFYEDTSSNGFTPYTGFDVTKNNPYWNP